MHRSLRGHRHWAQGGDVIALSESVVRVLVVASGRRCFSIPGGAVLEMNLSYIDATNAAVPLLVANLLARLACCLDRPKVDPSHQSIDCCCAAVSIERVRAVPSRKSGSCRRVQLQS